MSILGTEQISQFIRDGFVHLPEAFPRPLAERCRALLWDKTGLEPSNSATWTQPVVRIGGCAEEPFERAANTGTLRGAYDQLVGAGRWVAPRGLGTFPIRFPSPDDPGDTGWHLDGSYAQDGDTWPWVNLYSYGRALLMLFLFSDIGPADAPTRIRVGSHGDVPPFLVEHGNRGRSSFELCQAMDAAGVLASPRRADTLATGRAGDVYLCHPFLIHGAQPHHGRNARFIAQPPLEPRGQLDLDRADHAYSPVEIAIRDGLGWDTPATSN